MQVFRDPQVFRGELSFVLVTILYSKNNIALIRLSAYVRTHTRNVRVDYATAARNIC